MKTHTLIKVLNRTARKLKVAASLQPQKTTMVALVDRLIDDELQRLHATDLVDASWQEDTSGRTRATDV
jgi:hypothetical protein